jgi:hypothetical protein
MRIAKVTDKQDVVRRHKERLLARQALISDAKGAKNKLSPASLFEEWKFRQRSKIKNAANNVTQFGKDNAIVIGSAFGLGAILAASWRPVKNLIRGRNENYDMVEDEDRN